MGKLTLFSMKMIIITCRKTWCAHPVTGELIQDTEGKVSGTFQGLECTCDEMTRLNNLYGMEAFCERAPLTKNNAFKTETTYITALIGSLVAVI